MAGGALAVSCWKVVGLLDLLGLRDYYQKLYTASGHR